MTSREQRWSRHSQWDNEFLQLYGMEFGFVQDDLLIQLIRQRTPTGVRFYAELMFEL